MATPLYTSVTATFFGDDPTNSFASEELLNGRAGYTWRIRRFVASSTSDTTAPPRLFIYRNYESPSSLIDSTMMAIADTSETDVSIGSNEKLVFRWFGGTVGATATVVLTGDIL